MKTSTKRNLQPLEIRVGRSEDYYEMTAEEQWSDDKRLGILDWDGSEQWLDEHQINGRSNKMICEKKWAKQTGGRYLGTCQCEDCTSTQALHRKIARLEGREAKRKNQRKTAKKKKAMTREQVKQALHNVLSIGYDANSVMVMFMAFHHSMPSWDTWEWVEELIEEVVGEKPEWHECKKMLREIRKQINA